jgi:hypothetical protein
MNEGGKVLHNKILDVQGDGEGVWVLVYLELMVFPVFA